MKNLLRILVVISFVIILPIGAVALVSNPSSQNVICGSGELWDNARGCVPDPLSSLILSPNSSQGSSSGPIFSGPVQTQSVFCDPGKRWDDILVECVPDTFSGLICDPGERLDNILGCVPDPYPGLILDPNSSQGSSSGQNIGTTSSRPCVAGTGKICDPLGGRFGTVPELIKTILEGAIRIGMPIVALAIVYCGFLFVSASGNPEKLKKAKDALLWTLIGAAVLLGSWAIAKMISDTVLAL